MTAGIQLSQQAVPTAVENGINLGPELCFLYGSHTPFDRATLMRLIPKSWRLQFRRHDHVAARYILQGRVHRRITSCERAPIIRLVCRPSQPTWPWTQSP
jgi:hypothetical protein